MKFGRLGLVAVLIVALGAFALDCLAVTPQQAMQWCHSMRCASHGHHGMDCCKTMPAMRATLGQPSSVEGLSFTHVAFGVVEALNIFCSLVRSRPAIILDSLAPPGTLYPALLALRSEL